MRLRELYAKGLACSPEPIALPLADARCVVRLEPERLSAMARCLESLLYPEQVGVDARSALAAASGFECGLIFRAGKHDLRLHRSVGDDTLELQLRNPDDGRFATRARGSGPVAAAMTERLGRPSWERFLWLHLGGGRQEAAAAVTPEPASPLDDVLAEWLEPTSHGLASKAGRAGEPSPDDSAPRLPNPLDHVGPVVGASRSAAEIERLRAEYRRAQEAEALEDRLNELRRQLAELTPRSPARRDPGLEALDDALAGAPETEASEEELAVLRSPETRLGDFERRREALAKSLTETRQRLGQGGSPWRSPGVIAGVVLTIASTAVSILGGPSLRPVALSNVAWLAVVLAGLLQYLRGRDEGRTHQQRIFALEEAKADLDEERHAFERDLAAARRRYGVQNAEDLLAARRRRQQVSDARAAVEETRRAEEQTARAAGEGSRRELEAELARLDAERQALGDCPLASFQIAQELRNLGLEPGRADADAPSPAPASAGLAQGAPLERFDGGDSERAAVGAPPPLFELASRLGLVEGTGLEAGARRLWGRMLASLLERPLPHADIGRGNAIRLGPGPDLAWVALRPSERALVIDSACLALLLRSLGKGAPAPWPFIVRLDPFALHADEDVARLQGLYDRVAEHLQVVVLDSGARGR
jgi:hypothetical protein